ncbi:Uncharacterised protein [Mycobacteroides abscessus subsp. abscessus]|nr:Uncharacterised protein [Mycobacteroides abscessus subsp. abscessus]
MCTFLSYTLSAREPFKLLVTACVLDTFLDSRRSRSSMFLKSMFPPTFSW